MPRELRPEDIDYLILHCSAGSKESTASGIRAYHKRPKAHGGRGWSDIGYHFVVRYYGEKYSEVVEPGRPRKYQGAQARGFNSRSLGICMVGNFDEYDPSEIQYASTVEIVAALAMAYEVPPDCILGHRETYDLLGQRRLKTCPGKRVDMEKFRTAVALRLDGGDSLLRPEWW